MIDMTSKELNEGISVICDEPVKYGYECYGGKSIPYVGWFWRTVNFNSKNYSFGVLPDGELGFMQNNKWDYGYRGCNKRTWELIKTALIEAVKNPCRESLKRVDDLIQGI